MSDELTGRKRFRIQPATWRKPSLVVLQVECQTWRYENCGVCVDAERVAMWRDARVEDITGDVFK